ncbi:hypothetical protein D3C81_1697950 [compost metagenome]
MHFRWRQNLPSQPLGTFGVEQVFQIHAQTAPVPFVGDNRCRASGAVRDRAADMRGPYRRAVFTNRWHNAAAFQLLQRCTGANPPGEEFRLTFGHRALNAWRGNDGTALEIIAEQLCRIEMGAEQHGIRQHRRQRPVAVERGAAGGEGGGEIHGGHFAG